MNFKLVIDLPLAQFDETRIRELEQTASSTGEDASSFVVAASHVSLSTTALEMCHTTGGATEEAKQEPAQWAVFFLSPAITESAVSKDMTGILSHDETLRLSRRLLSMVHPFLAQNFCLKGIVSLHNPQHAPADLVLLDLSHAPLEVEDHLMQITNGQVIHSGPEDCVLKTLLISQLEFQWEGAHRNGNSGHSTPDVAARDKKPPPQPQSTTTHHDEYSLPTCPVCLHRIDPSHLGLPSPLGHQLCSQFCTPPNLVVAAAATHHNQNGPTDSLASSTSSSSACPCPQQRLLRPWASPCNCYACHVIDKYWKTQGRDDADNDNVLHHKSSTLLLRCFQCQLKETLWVCLTCGYVGCGRYSNGHSVEHFDHSQHPYSLELATLRIWDYATGDFSHRADLLQCPSSPPLLFPWIQPGGVGGHAHASPYYEDYDGAHYDPLQRNGMILPQQDLLRLQHHHQDVLASPTEGPWTPAAAAAASSSATAAAGANAIGHGRAAAAAGRMPQEQQPTTLNSMKSPKKAFMIGEEYEALLQSALEDQAQHYEGEMTGLRARLSGETFDKSTMTRRDKDEMETLQAEIASLRTEIDRTSRELVDWQGQEAGCRAASHRLLREQQVVQGLLATLQEETAREQAAGTRQMEELELQIADLTANQKMRRQFSEDEELKQAQIWSMADENTSNGRKKGGKKPNKRGFRKS